MISHKLLASKFNMAVMHVNPGDSCSKKSIVSALLVICMLSDLSHSALKFALLHVVKV